MSTRILRTFPEMCEALLALFYGPNSTSADFTLEFCSRSCGDAALCRAHIALMGESKILETWDAWDTDYAILHFGVVDDTVPECDECERAKRRADDQARLREVRSVS